MKRVKELRSHLQFPPIIPLLKIKIESLVSSLCSGIYSPKSDLAKKADALRKEAEELTAPTIELRDRMLEK